MQTCRVHIETYVYRIEKNRVKYCAALLGAAFREQGALGRKNEEK